MSCAIVNIDWTAAARSWYLALAASIRASAPCCFSLPTLAVTSRAISSLPRFTETAVMRMPRFQSWWRINSLSHDRSGLHPTPPLENMHHSKPIPKFPPKPRDPISHQPCNLSTNATFPLSEIYDTKNIIYLTCKTLGKQTKTWRITNDIWWAPSVCRQTTTAWL